MFWIGFFTGIVSASVGLFLLSCARYGLDQPTSEPCKVCRGNGIIHGVSRGPDDPRGGLPRPCPACKPCDECGTNDWQSADMIASLDMTNAPHFRKTASVQAYQMQSTFEVATLEGTMRGQSGDYLCQGPAGERWPIKREIFEATYEACPKCGGKEVG